MKILRSGQAEPLNPETFLRLYQELKPPHNFILGVTWYCAERVGAVCQLRRANVYDRKGKPLDAVVIPGASRKDRCTREVSVTPKLRKLLIQIPKSDSEWLFPSQLNPKKHIHPDCYKAALSRACKRLGLVGYSSHSARRGAITHLARSGISVRVIQQISGHKSLASVQRYIDFDSIEVRGGLELL
ncbi:tyrosine-type recombinase/integrase [Candidatus Synechococcus calcipolaris]|uniref:tyrosine-type recombinase/integrase n=1 Tax=Candidatus Synechococcus calcipolaris TaxID=1522304 RepID=UPI003BA87F77